MATVSIARRYARALLEADSAGGHLDRSSEQLWAFASLLKTHDELSQLFGNPSFSRAQRQSVAAPLIKSFGDVSPALNGMLRLLIERDRVLLLPDIARLFRDMVDTKQGRVRGEVTSAVPLADDVLHGLEQALERAMQRDVLLQARVNPQLIGGISARVGSLTFDGSLRTQLETLRERLKQ